MAKVQSKRIVTVESEDKGEVEVTEYFRSLGDPATVIKLYRYANYPNKPEWIEDITWETIKAGSIEQYLRGHELGGPGSYLVRGVIGGRWIKDGAKIVHIAGTKPQSTPPATVTDKKESDNLRFFEVQANLQHQSSQAMMQIFQASMQQTTQMIVAIITNAGGKNDLASLAALWKEMNPNGNQLPAILESVKTITDIASNLGGGNGAPADPLTAAIGLLPALIESKQKGNGHAAPAPAAVPAVNVAPAPPASAPPVLDERIVLLQKLKKKAELSQDVHFWADYLDTNTDEPACMIFANACKQYPWEALLQTLVKHDPQLGQEPYLSWFHDLYNEVRQDQPIDVQSHDSA